MTTLVWAYLHKIALLAVKQEQVLGHEELSWTEGLWGASWGFPCRIPRNLGPGKRLPPDQTGDSSQVRDPVQETVHSRCHFGSYGMWAACCRHGGRGSHNSTWTQNPSLHFAETHVFPNRLTLLGTISPTIARYCETPIRKGDSGFSHSPVLLVGCWTREWRHTGIR